jgi:hypothetical protein
MSDQFALEPAVVAPSSARLATLELQLAERERALAGTRRELQELQSSYLNAVGGYYAQLVEIEAQAVDLEVRLGLRPAVEDEPSEPEGDPSVNAEGCSNRSVPSQDLKKIFRNLARTIHPDLALDEPARWRRHSLMAEANRAYAERDEDRLRLILHAWERSPDAVLGDDPEADEERLRRRIAAIEDRLLELGREVADLETSAIANLKRKIDDARAQGWDLLAEMIREVKREVGRAKAKLVSLQRMTI